MPVAKAMCSGIGRSKEVRKMAYLMIGIVMLLVGALKPGKA